ncbi:MAG: anthranilate phosphoribosyltransferase [Lentisphaeria bacterium]|nr:anthranilate phosphoribosyltransferase [Lentisphaeria bacterium]
MEEQLREFGRLICRVAAGEMLSREEACEAYRQVILNEQPELQQGAFLMAHITRHPSLDELAGAWDAVQRYDTSNIHYEGTGVVCDIVGTGSDALKTVNCSSPASLLAAAAGLPVAKKGARLVTGVSGASDVFELWGIDLDAPLERAANCLNVAGICYLPGEAFLQKGWARLIRSMRFTSAFNIIGPLTMPCAQTTHIVIGAYAPEVCDQLIPIVREIGMAGALSPYGWIDGGDPTHGMDEFSPCGPTRVVELRDGVISVHEVTPGDFGCRTCRYEEVASHPTAQGNASAALEVLAGRAEGALADFFCMNAGAALYASGRAKSYREGTEQARGTIVNGAALEKLEALRQYQGAV